MEAYAAENAAANAADHESTPSDASIIMEKLRTKTWDGGLNGPDGESLRAQLQSLLQHSALRDSDLYSLLVMPLVKGEGTLELTRAVFQSSMHRIGYSGPPNMLVTLFKKIDSSSNGIIGFSELRKYCHASYTAYGCPQLALPYCTR